MSSDSDSDMENAYIYQELLQDGQRNPRQRQVFEETL